MYNSFQHLIFLVPIFFNLVQMELFCLLMIFNPNIIDYITLFLRLCAILADI